eukprot:jgi/Ulvmu1/11123/UM071_0006.1
MLRFRRSPDWQGDVPLVQRRLVPDGHDGSPLLGWDNEPTNMCIRDLLMIDKDLDALHNRGTGAMNRNRGPGALHHPASGGAGTCFESLSPLQSHALKRAAVTSVPSTTYHYGGSFSQDCFGLTAQMRPGRRPESAKPFADKTSNLGREASPATSLTRRVEFVTATSCSPQRSQKSAAGSARSPTSMIPLPPAFFMATEKLSGASAPLPGAARSGSSLPLPPTSSPGSPSGIPSFSSPLHTQGTLLATSFSSISTPNTYTLTRDSPEVSSAAPQPVIVSLPSLLPKRASPTDLAAIEEAPPRLPRRPPRCPPRGQALPHTPARAYAETSTLRLAPHGVSAAALPQLTPSARFVPAVFSMATPDAPDTESPVTSASSMVQTPVATRLPPVSQIPRAPGLRAVREYEASDVLSSGRTASIPSSPVMQLITPERPERVRGDHSLGLSAPWQVTAHTWPGMPSGQGSSEPAPRGPANTAAAWQSPPHMRLQNSLAGNTSWPSSPGSSTLLVTPAGAAASEGDSGRAGLLDASHSLHACVSSVARHSCSSGGGVSVSPPPAGGRLRRLRGRAQAAWVSLTSPRRCCGGLAVVDDDAISRGLP